jgi:hypothetical protein
VFLLASYDDPFSGEVSVKPHAFEVARESLGRRFKPLEKQPLILNDEEESEVDNSEGDTLDDDTHNDSDSDAHSLRQSKNDLKAVPVAPLKK